MWTRFLERDMLKVAACDGLAIMPSYFKRTEAHSLSEEKEKEVASTTEWIGYRLWLRNVFLRGKLL
jgi:hypothetical protein